MLVAADSEANGEDIEAALSLAISSWLARLRTSLEIALALTFCTSLFKLSKSS